MRDVMLDLETMGTGPQAAIVAIGAVEFDREAGLLGERFYTTVDLVSACAVGGQIDPATVIWWMRQSEEARAAIDVAGTNIAPALASFSGWLRARDDLSKVRIWGNGANFDNVILASAYRAIGVTVPWKFWNDRCYRTWKSEHADCAAPPRKGTHHNALDDAVFQAEHMISVPFQVQSAA